MKILYHHRIASKDGQFVHVEELTNALKRQGHEIIMVGPAVVDNNDFGSHGGIVASLKKYAPGFLYELMEFGYNLVVVTKLYLAIKKHNPDCMYERYNLYLTAGVWLKKLCKLPMLLEVNSPLFQERSKYSSIALPRLAKWTEQYAWQGADGVLPVTEVLANMIIQDGVEAQRVTVIANGIDPHKFNCIPDLADAKRRLGLDQKLVLGFTGFMREWHGLERVVDIIAQHDDRHLLIVGDGPARSNIEQRAQELGVSNRVTITGVIGRDDIINYVSAFDIALQPDVVNYASPLKLFEYLALGRAIVAPDSPNIREVLRHEHNALLFDINDKNAFTREIERLCEDSTLRMKIAQAAHATILEGQYTWDQNAVKVTHLFTQLGVGSNVQ